MPQKDNAELWGLRSHTNDWLESFLGGEMSELKGVDRLHKAVQNLVEKNGGKVLVIGGVEVQKWPEDFSLNFRIAVKCTGTPPQVDSDKKSKKEKRV